MDEIVNKLILAIMRSELKVHFEKKGFPKETAEALLSTDAVVSGLWGYLKKSGEL